MSRNVRAHVVVTGRVQGVAYRWSAQQEGRRLGLAGQIRNLPDGSVEAIVEGPHPSVDAFVAWCRRGPETAIVEHVEVKFGDATGEFRGFSVAP
jgi:acylphosphatase